MVVITDVIAMVGGAAENGGKPNGIKAEIVNVIEFFDDSPQCTSKRLEQVFSLKPTAVRTRVEAIDKDLVNAGGFGPGGGNILRIEPAGKLGCRLF